MQNGPKTIACCRVSVREKDIFRLWIAYYKDRVTYLAAVIILENDENADDLETLCRESGVTYGIHHTSRFHPGGSMMALETVVKKTNADWILHADSDEFLYEVNDLDSILRRMGEENADFAIAWMADRLAFGGQFAPVEHLKSVEELEAAFPVRAAVTEKLAKGCPYKVCLSKWPHMGAIHTPQPPLKGRASKRLTFEHFKWRSGLEERLEKRIRDHAASKLPWGVESRRILNELNAHGRIRAERCLAPRCRRIHGWMDYENVYRSVVEMTPDGGRLVEVGVWQGRSLCFLAEAALAAGKQFEIYGIDPFRNYSATKTGYPKHLRGTVTKHSWLDLVTSNLRQQGMLDYVNLIQAPSLKGARLFDSCSLDFVWLDGAHDYHSVIADIQTWWPKLKSNGLLAGHDYNQPQIRRAVNEMKVLTGQAAKRGNSFLLKKTDK